MKRREFGEPIKRYLIEEDRLIELLQIEHELKCGVSDPFEYFWDMMVESGCDQHVSHREFVNAVENMTFYKLAEMDLALYEELEEDKMIENVIWIIEDASHGVLGAAKTELGAWKAYIEQNGVLPDEQVYLNETEEYKTVRECLGRLPGEEISIEELAQWCIKQGNDDPYMWDDWVYIYRVEYHNE